MKTPIAYAIVLLIAIAFFVQPALAYTQMASPFIDSCDFLYMEPTQFSDLIVFEFNNVNIATTSFDTINIDFPAFADGLHIGPAIADAGVGVTTTVAPTFIGTGAGASATANVLPFGPVNLAFPDISQTAFDAYVYQRTYFYSDIGA